MNAPASQVSFASRDGLRLSGTLVQPPAPTAGAVLVHGGGVTREEGGFFTRLAEGLADAGVASLRFDLRGHGHSEGRQEDLTLAGVANDIRAAMTELRGEAQTAAVHLIGASFGGGICALVAATAPEEVAGLVLFNPLLDYKDRFIEQKPYWHGDQIDEAAGRDLLRDGFVRHSPSVKLGRGLLNEVFYLRPNELLGTVTAPTLIIHGTADTFIPITSSREALPRFGGTAELLELAGAQHGVAVPDDPGYRDPQTQAWQADVIHTVGERIVSASL